MVKKVDRLLRAVLAEERAMAKQAWDDIMEEMAEQRRLQCWVRGSIIQGQEGLDETIRRHQQDAMGQHREASAALERFHKLLDSLEELEVCMQDMKQEAEENSQLQPPDLAAFCRARERFDEANYDSAKIIDTLDEIQRRIQLLNSQRKSKPRRGGGEAGGPAQLAPPEPASAKLQAAMQENLTSILDYMLGYSETLTLLEQRANLAARIGPAQAATLSRVREHLEKAVSEARGFRSELATGAEEDKAALMAKLENSRKNQRELGRLIVDLSAAAGA